MESQKFLAEDNVKVGPQSKKWFRKVKLPQWKKICEEKVKLWRYFRSNSSLGKSNKSNSQSNMNKRFKETTWFLIRVFTLAKLQYFVLLAFCGSHTQEPLKKPLWCASLSDSWATSEDKESKTSEIRTVYTQLTRTSNKTVLLDDAGEVQTLENLFEKEEGRVIDSESLEKTAKRGQVLASFLILRIF